MLLITKNKTQHREVISETFFDSLVWFAQLLDRCSDGMIFGRLLPCDECSGGQLVYGCVKESSFHKIVKPKGFQLQMFFLIII